MVLQLCFILTWQHITQIDSLCRHPNLTMSLLSEQPVSLPLTPERSSERAHIPLPETLADSLLLADAEYIDLAYFAKLSQYGGYFLMRGPKHMNPKVTQAMDVRGRNISRMEGLHLK